MDADATEQADTEDDGKLVTVLPTYLEVQPDPTHLPLPVVTRQRPLLPFASLRWEDFERLCVAYVRETAEVEGAWLYGRRGQQQHGIDLFARHSDGTFTVTQCKQMASFTEADVSEAVERFLNGPWASRATTFQLATSFAINADTKLQDAVVEQGTKLRQRGIRFDVLDPTEFTERLRTSPQIVDDFFGRAWVSALLGPDAAGAFKHRLDGAEMATLRARLLGLYESLFARNDPGIPAGNELTVRLADRFVVPDIWSMRAAQPLDGSSVREEPRDPDATRPFAPSAAQQRSQLPARDERHRETFDGWLADASRVVVIGDPGAGKTSLLRFLTLDLLSDAPSLSATSANWRKRLPVWLPFAYLARLPMGPDQRTRSIVDCMRSWLEEWDASDVWPLIERALADERLLLVIDGLDEASEESSRLAVDQIEVFVSYHKSAVVLSGRPSGTTRATLATSAWKFGEIAPLTAAQRRDVVQLWFRHRAKALQQRASLPDDEVHRSDAEAQEFLQELHAVRELEELAGTPLLLSLLILLRFRHAELPRGRFDAYSHFVEHLVEEHPTARALAARTTRQRPVSSNDFLQVVASIAFDLQRRSSLAIPENDLRERVADLLQERFELDRIDAYSRGDSLLLMATETSGILVSLAPGEVGFLHRAFQEFLAARHLSGRPLPEQQAIVTEHASDSAWREVLLGLLWYVRKEDDFEQIVNCIALAESTDVFDGYRRDELLAEIAFGDFAAQGQIGGALATNAFALVERDVWMPHRRQLLEHIVRASPSARTQTAIASHLSRWLQSKSDIWRRGAMTALCEWPADSLTAQILLHALGDEDSGVGFAAGEPLARLLKSNADVANEVEALAAGATSPLVRAAALRALDLAGTRARGVFELANQNRRAPSFEMRVSAIAFRVHRGIVDLDDLDSLIAMTRGAYRYGEWADEIPRLLVAGWTGSPELKEFCLGSNETWQPNQDMVEYLWLNAFPDDQDATEFVLRELRDEFPFNTLRRSGWDHLARNFKDHPAVVAEVDAWFERPPRIALTELPGAATVGRTAIAKRYCLEQLRTNSLPHWAASALLDNWGMDDMEVAEAFQSLLRENNSQCALFAHLVPRIVDSPQEARSRLVALLADSPRPDFALLGLVELGADGDDDEVVDLALKSRRPGFHDTTWIILNDFATHPDVRKLALDLLTQGIDLNPIVAGFGHDDEIRSAVAAHLTPLPRTLRAAAIREIGRAIDDELAPASILFDFATDEDRDLKILRAVEYGEHALRDRDPAVLTAAIGSFTRELTAVGPDYDARVLAGIAGLVTVGEWDSIAKWISTTRAQARLSLSSLTGDAFFQVLVEHWAECIQSLGDNPVALLSRGEGTSQTELWARLAPLVSAHPSVHEALLTAIEADPHLRAYDGIVEFVAAVRPRSTLLRDVCFGLLRSGDASLRDVRRTWRAAITLARQFGSDAGVRDELVTSPWRLDLRSPDGGRMIALALGWPADPVIARLYRQLLRPDRPGISYPVYFALSFAAVPNSRIGAELERCLADAVDAGTETLAYAGDALVRRLELDESAAAALQKELLSGGHSASFIATAARALAAARGVSAELRTWCVTEIFRQRAEVIPALGLDLLTVECRPVEWSLLETLRLGGPN